VSGLAQSSGQVQALGQATAGHQRSPALALGQTQPVLSSKSLWLHLPTYGMVSHLSPQHLDDHASVKHSS